jgi:hypothetical protein
MGHFNSSSVQMRESVKRNSMSSINGIETRFGRSEKGREEAPWS